MVHLGNYKDSGLPGVKSAQIARGQIQVLPNSVGTITETRTALHPHGAKGEEKDGFCLQGAYNFTRDIGHKYTQS